MKEERSKLLSSEEVTAGIGSKGTRTVLPPRPSDVRESERPPIAIVNVGPESWTVALGNMGTFIIPASQGDEPGMLLVPRLLFDTQIDIEQTVNVQDFDGGPWRMKPCFRQIPVYGMEVAEEITGTAKYRGISDNLTRWGVFIACGPNPTSEELDTAKTSLLSSYAELVTQMATFIYHKETINISDRHLMALRYLKEHGGMP